MEIILVVLWVRHFLDALDGLAPFGRCLTSRLEEVSDYLMAVRGDADFFARFDEGADHLCSGVGLAGTGWPLDRQAALKKRSHSDRRVDSAFVGALELLRCQS